MNTEKTLHLMQPNADTFHSLFNQSRQLKKISAQLSDFTEQISLYGQIVNVLSYYDLGRVVDVYEIFGGYSNKSFGVVTEQKGLEHRYFLRMYKPTITETELLLEHSMIDFSIAHGLDIAAGLIRNRDQKTYVKITEEVNGVPVDQFFAIYDFLAGEDKYTWDNPSLTDEEYASAAEVLATFHNAARNFDPKGRRRVEPKIMELLPMLPEVFKEFATREVNTKFHKYFIKNLNEIIEVLSKGRIPEKELKKMPLNPIHSDFHPGNLKFKDNKVSGIFDFDWCKIDLRLFDVCLAVAYACCSWSDEQDGALLPDKCAIFLASYQKTLRALGGLQPLNKAEIEHFPAMLAYANIYLINWTVTTYYTGSDLNIYEYLAYLQHNVRLMKWIDSHEQELLQIAKSVM